MTDFRVVIPARYASQRLPGKPLLDIAGRPMVQHVYERALASGAAQVVVATDDARIDSAVRGFGGEVCMTSADHASGTDRIAEVAARGGWSDETVVVNLQGDEPLIPVELLSFVAQTLESHADAEVATLAVPLVDAEQLFDTNTVKVVMDANGYALYFSRATIPWQRDRFVPGGDPQPDWLEGMFRHLGLYAYRAGLLHRYAALTPSPIERMESLEQLRVLWHGGRIAVAVADVEPPPGVDTQADLERVRRALGQP
jgi:3-deoxy-manno-octulosonate cytidylyltransferase (CMP-KDO synthetase)